MEIRLIMINIKLGGKNFILIFFMLVACDVSKRKFFVIANNKYDKIYVTNYGSYETNKDNRIEFQYGENIVTFLNKDITGILGFEDPLLEVKIYKDGSRQCLIYHYTKKEILKMIKDENLEVYQTVFIIDENDKLKPIKETEFEKNKQDDIYKMMKFDYKYCIEDI